MYFSSGNINQHILILAKIEQYPSLYITYNVFLLVYQAKNVLGSEGSEHANVFMGCVCFPIFSVF
jgi:hypothetical protein